jgi:hypothetical protein
MADDTFPGIEIRIYTENGELLHSRSDTLHYELMKMWLENGFTGNEWYPLVGFPVRAALVEVRAVDVPRLPIELELERELEASTAERCCVCGSSDVGYHNYRDQAFCWPCADGRPPAAAAAVDVDGQAAELAGAVCTATWDCGGFEGDRPWHGTRCILPAGHDDWHRGPDDPTVINGYITWLRNRPAPLLEVLEATAPVADPVPDPSRGERWPVISRWPPRPCDIWLARIARRARFRSGR